MALAFDGAGNLFVGTGGLNGGIYELTPGGVKTTFATGLPSVSGLAFDSADDLFVASFTNPVSRLPGSAPALNAGIIYEFTPGGVKSTFAAGLLDPLALAFDSKGDLFVSSGQASGVINGAIYEYAPGGGRSTFATGLLDPNALAFDNAGDLYVSDGANFGPNLGGIYKYISSGVRSTFASGVHANGLAFQGETLPVPEPGTLALLAASAIFLLGRRHHP